MAAAAPRTAASRQTAVRRDPRPQHTDGESPLLQLKNKREGFSYVLANKGGVGTTGVGYYKAIGYEVIPTPAPGEKSEDFFLGHTSEPGAPLEQMGMIAMRCSDERRAQIEEEGYDGGSGQAQADAIEKRIQNKKAAYVDRTGIGPGITAQSRTRGEMPLMKDEAEGDISLE